MDTQYDALISLSGPCRGSLPHAELVGTLEEEEELKTMAEAGNAGKPANPIHDRTEGAHMLIKTHPGRTGWSGISGRTSC